MLPRHDTRQLYIKRIETQNRSTIQVSYEVRVLTHSCLTIKLLTGLADEEQARFIEREVEKYLQIKNVPVQGEYT